MKIKKEKDFRTGTCTSARELCRSKSFHTLRNPLMVGGKRAFWNFRGEFSNRCSEDKTERIHHGDHCQTALPRREVAHTPAQGAEAQSGSGIWPQGEDLGWLPQGYSEGAGEMQLRESRMGMGHLREAGGCNHQDILTSPAATKISKTGRSTSSRIGLQFMIPEEET